jgi:hypothetical protein
VHPEKASTKDVLNLSTNHLARRTVKDGLERKYEFILAVEVPEKRTAAGSKRR